MAFTFFLLVTICVTMVKLSFGEYCPYHFEIYNGNCYGVDHTSLTIWGDAEFLCTSFGGHLTSITFLSELYFLTDLVRRKHDSYTITSTLWVGLYKVNPTMTDSEWRWTDGSTLNIPNLWDSGDPDPKDIVTRFRDGRLVGDEYGSGLYHYICKTPVWTTPSNSGLLSTKFSTAQQHPTTLPTLYAQKTREMFTTAVTTTPPTIKTSTIPPTTQTSTTTPSTQTSTTTPTSTTAPTTKTATTTTTSTSTSSTSTTMTTTTQTPSTTSTTTSSTATSTSSTTTKEQAESSNFTTPVTTKSDLVTATPNGPILSTTSDASKTSVAPNGTVDVQTVRQQTGKEFAALAAIPVLLLLIILLVIFIRRQKSRRSHYPASTGHTLITFDQSKLIQLENLGYYLTYPGIGIVEKEYKTIPGRSHSPCEVGRLHPTKNMSKNIIPYDENRVELIELPSYPSSTYINASYIKGYNSTQNAYIAAQGPRQNTVEDFWRMIWEQAVSVIVMLTSPADTGKGKCLIYWPVKETETVKYGGIEVTLEKQHAFVDDTVRLFFVQKAGQTRRVTQYYFHSWPDGGAPTYPITLLNFRRKIKRRLTPNSHPVLVHCSSGIGRTGTFIAIDLLLDQAMKERVVDILGCVSKLRQQRPWMVENVKEYKCVYHAVYEGVTSGTTTISRDQFPAVFRMLCSEQGDVVGMTKLQQQFQTLKNIETELKLLGTIDTLRAMMRGITKLKEKPKNFIEVDGFKRPKAYLVSGVPHVAIANSFWNAMYEKKCRSIVMLCPRENLSILQTYFPDEEEATIVAPPYTIECTNVVADKIRPVVVNEMKMYGERKTEHHLSHVSVKVDLADLEMQDQAKLLVYLHKLVQRRNASGRVNNAPTLIHCLNGSDWSGLFCILSYLLDQLDSEGEADVFQAVRQGRHIHPSLLQNETQYYLLHEAICCYLESRSEPFSVL